MRFSAFFAARYFAKNFEKLGINGRGEGHPACEKGGMHMGKAMDGVARRAQKAIANAKEFVLNYAYLMTLGAALLGVAASALYT